MLKQNFTHRFTVKNPEYTSKKIIRLEVADGSPLRSCQINNKADRFLKITRTPKWLSSFYYEAIDEDTGEVTIKSYNSDNLKASNMRKLKALRKFCDYYEPLYQKRKISLLFHTFTRLTHSTNDMRSMIAAAKLRYKRLGYPVRGYMWVMEVSERNHVHYHLAVAINRLNVKQIPTELKFNDLWGQRTGVEFIKKSIRAYFMKYLNKDGTKVLEKRNYAISRKLI